MNRLLRIAGTNHALALGSYLALMVLQTVWHALLPAPHGAGLWWLAIIATLPLIPPLKGICLGSLRSMTWGGYLLLLYFAIGVMEAWSNPTQRLPAAGQIVLAVTYLYAILRFSREQS